MYRRSTRRDPRPTPPCSISSTSDTEGPVHLETPLVWRTRMGFFSPSGDQVSRQGRTDPDSAGRYWSPFSSSVAVPGSPLPDPNGTVGGLLRRETGDTPPQSGTTLGRGRGGRSGRSGPQTGNRNGNSRTNEGHRGNKGVRTTRCRPHSPCGTPPLSAR